MSDILSHLVALYGDEVGHATFGRVTDLVENARRSIVGGQSSPELSERDALLITYGDQVRTPGEPPLQTLADFCTAHLRGIVSGIHLLPFFPYSSDDGFSVIDYRTVDPALGTWNDLARFREDFRLMFDLVANHVSAQSKWFQGFLRDDPRERGFFIVVPDGADVSRVVRPRTMPLVTRFDTPRGAKNVWTTFSVDQVDLNYSNPDVLLEIVDVLLFYLARGAEYLRLDAVAFLWKEFGTTCLHLPQTHRIVQLFRAILDEIAPQVILITETNVPHADNISYFGNGMNEAQMVYNFALPPLVLNAFNTGDARTLARWARELSLPSDRVTFFNFLASHDGIGLNPARGILKDEEIDALVACTEQHGGFISYKNNHDGTSSPYELNISLFDALSAPHALESLDIQIERFVSAHAIMLAFTGVPGIYFHSLFGSRSWNASVTQTDRKRTVNREKLSRGRLEYELSDPTSLRQRVFARLKRLLQVRSAHKAFGPYAPMRIIEENPSVLAVLRSKAGDQSVFCLHNVSSEPQQTDLSGWDIGRNASRELVDLITDQTFDRFKEMDLAPYQTLWLKPVS